MIVKAEKVIYFELLGSISYSHVLMSEPGISEEDSEIETEREREIKYHVIPEKIGKKTLSFLQYLIANHSRNIPSEELIDVFWPNSSTDPANALRNMLFKIRVLLRTMFPEEVDLLQTFQGYYAWNPQIRIEVDYERFESLCLEARKCSGRDRKESRGLLLKAVSLYKGDFLPGNDGEWARTSRQYYRTLFLDACRALLPLLENAEEWVEMIRICDRAYQIDFCMEEFTAYQMQAFIAMGQPEQAIERYEAYREKVFKELEMPPTERIEQIYTLALGLRRENRGNDEEIFRLVCEESSSGQAFLCSFGTFRSIVALERRHLSRTKQKSVLVIVSLGSGAVPTTDARRLEKILLEGLREGDPVARLEAGAYILMLTGVDADSAQIVTGRIDSLFHKTYRHSSAQLTFRMSELRLNDKEERYDRIF